MLLSVQLAGKIEEDVEGTVWVEALQDVVIVAVEEIGAEIIISK